MDPSELIAEEEEVQLQYPKEDIRAYAKEDMDFFAGLAAPEDATLSFPNFYTWLWRTLTTLVLSPVKSFEKYAIGLPRGHGKTFVVKLLILYAIIYSKKRYIMVVGANLRKAQDIIDDIADFLNSPNIQEVYGNWRINVERDTQDLKSFTFNGRKVILEAVGYGTALRGSNKKNARPDFIVCDDVQTKECAESIVESSKFAPWFRGTLMKAKSPKGCLFIYIGNMYKDIKLIDRDPPIYCCMLRNMQLSTEWTSFIVGAILADGGALWEELHSREDLLAEFEGDFAAGQAETFFAEVLNDPQTTTSFYIDVTKVGKREPNPDELHQGNYIVIDPATSKATPDQVVIGYNEIFDNIPVCQSMIVDKLSAPDIVMETIKLALEKQCSLIVVEANAYQYSLVEWFEFFFGQMSINGIHVEPLYTRGVSKNSRILAFFKSLVNKEYLLASKVYNRFIHQATTFDPKITNNVDDILDMGEMSLQAAVKFRHLMTIPGELSLDAQFTIRGIPDQNTLPSPSGF